jgi:hypothetical protein
VPSRVCAICKKNGDSYVIPSAEYQAHRERHKRAGRPPHWSNEGRRNRQLALDRDGRRCRQCGLSQDQLKRMGRQLEVHHLRGTDACHRPIKTKRVAPLGGIPGTDQ